MPGTLYVVATPIGNLEDLTFRALRTLREVDLIAAEDTRRTAKLLAHYEIRKPLTSYREHNEAREAARLVARLQAGESIALVSDAGTPGIADPGARLVRAAREAGLPIVPIPGPSAIATALSVSGLDFDEFVFMGFPPAAGAARSEWFDRLGAETRPVVLFEAPHRVARTIDELVRSNRTLLVFRELTKINENLVISTNIVGASSVTARGEFVLVAAGREEAAGDGEIDIENAGRIYDALTGAGLDRAEALELTAKALGTAAKTLKKPLKQRRMYGKQPTKPSP